MLGTRRCDPQLEQIGARFVASERTNRGTRFEHRGMVSELPERMAERVPDQRAIVLGRGRASAQPGDSNAHRIIGITETERGSDEIRPDPWRAREAIARMGHRVGEVVPAPRAGRRERQEAP